LLELYSSARQVETHKNALKDFLQEAFLLRQSTCLSSLTVYFYASFRYSFRYCAAVHLPTESRNLFRKTGG